eukprot:TRINITY_DN12039_c0_g1_i1.p1 TRINITY_DN12039_c0_g1~~TRINITY_DN12039_c0_g1_i1.p1  ORF type:complete len:1034 (+),score=263.37 TRINITY_DN12039_c0_g1_i1:1657-4758(+)
MDGVTAALDDLPTAMEAPTIEQQDEQFFAVYTSRNSDLPIGSRVVSLDFTWFMKFRGYVKGKSSRRPGPISFQKFLDKEGKFQADCVPSQYVSEECFKMLESWYGVEDPQNIHYFPVVEEAGKPMVESTPMRLQTIAVAKASDVKGSVEEIALSRGDTIGFLKSKIAAAFDVPENSDMRLWTYQSGSWYQEFKDDEALLSRSGLSSAARIVLEYRVSQSDEWPSDSKDDSDDDLPNINVSGKSSRVTTTYGSNGTTGSSSSINGYNNTLSSSTSNKYPTTSYSSSSYSSYSSYNSPRRPGETGLRNLGNTCFMNSALQCLSHCQDLAAYFAGNTWESEINRDNPIGQGGRMAQTFAELLRKLWSGAHRDVSPYSLKDLIARVAPQFSGYQQHDSQELTTFLLDSLHEDLNRILKKPFVEDKEAEGDDVIAAQEAWDRFQLRNDSQLVDLFFGQYKSTLICPECQKVSVTFDPMMYLSVPIPELTTMTVNVRFIPWDKTQQHTQLGIEVPEKSGTLRQLLEKVGEIVGVSADEMIATDYYISKFWKVYHETDTTGNINVHSDTVYVYHVPTTSTNDIAVPVFLYTQPISSYTGYAYSSYRPSVGETAFGLPFFVRVPQEATEVDLRKRVDEQLRAFVTAQESSAAKPSAAGWARTRGSDKDDSEVETEGDAADAELEALYADNQKSASAQFGAATMELEEDAPVFDCSLSIVNAERGSASIVHDFDKDGETYKFSDGYRGDAIALHFPDKEKRRYDSTWAEDAIQHESAAALNAVSGKQRMDKQVKLDDCVKQFTKREVLSQDNMWYCPCCKEFRQAEKQLEVWRLPKNLIIHLKRFSYNANFREKIDTYVDFPLSKLDLSPYVLSPDDRDNALYDLYAVSNHMGNFGGGHYTAYAVDKDGNWANYDDSWVSAADENRIVSTNSYLLFYRRRERPDVHAVHPTVDLKDHGDDGDDAENIDMDQQQRPQDDTMHDTEDDDAIADDGVADDGPIVDQNGSISGVASGPQGSPGGFEAATPEPKDASVSDSMDGELD